VNAEKCNTNVRKNERKEIKINRNLNGKMDMILGDN